MHTICHPSLSFTNTRTHTKMLPITLSLSPSPFCLSLSLSLTPRHTNSPYHSPLSSSPFSLPLFSLSLSSLSPLFSLSLSSLSPSLSLNPSSWICRGKCSNLKARVVEIVSTECACVCVCEQPNLRVFTNFRR